MGSVAEAGSVRTGPVAETRELFDAIPDDEPGCSAAVFVDDGVAFAEAFGAASLDPLVPFEVDTVVDIASSSKQFTATAVGLLIIDGQIDPDESLAEVLDGLPGWAEEVTVAQLITHTSGIPDYIELLADDGVDLDQPADQADALAALAGAELDAEPGTTFAYSNSNYLLLAEVVAAVDGRDLSVFLADEVFGASGVDAVLAFPPPSPRRAVSYEFDDEWVVVDSPWTQVGDGAVRTTPAELTHFGATYWREDGPWDDLAALRDDLGVSTSGGSYSLGIERVEVGGRTAWTHSGLWSGFETAFTAVPELRTAVAVTCNSPDVEVDLDEIEKRILEIWRP